MKKINSFQFYIKYLILISIERSVLSQRLLLRSDVELAHRRMNRAPALGINSMAHNLLSFARQCLQHIL